MKVAVRLDHAPFIGLGHLKRSLEIAEQLRNINIESSKAHDVMDGEIGHGFGIC